MADEDDDELGPDELRVPFVFVPDGAPDPVEWMAEHPGWVRFPATLVPHEPSAPEPDPSPSPPAGSRTELYPMGVPVSLGAPVIKRPSGTRWDGKQRIPYETGKTNWTVYQYGGGEGAVAAYLRISDEMRQAAAGYAPKGERTAEQAASQAEPTPSTPQSPDWRKDAITPVYPVEGLIGIGTVGVAEGTLAAARAAGSAILRHVLPDPSPQTDSVAAAGSVRGEITERPAAKTINQDLQLSASGRLSHEARPQTRDTLRSDTGPHGTNDTSSEAADKDTTPTRGERATQGRRAEVSPERRIHILDGEENSGGHRAGTGRPGKSEFPSDWFDDRIIEEIEDVANDPRSNRKTQNNGRVRVEGMRDRVYIRVIIRPGDNSIVTAHPISKIVEP